MYTAVGRALWALTQALLPEVAEWPDEGDEAPEPAVAGPHPTAAEEGDLTSLPAGVVAVFCE